MDFTKEQLNLIKAGNPKVDLSLENEEVLAFFSLGQMHKKIVRMTDNFFEKTKVGIFIIDELNGKHNPDFSNPNDWQKVEINSITFSLTGPNEWGGEFKDTYQSLFDIKKIELLKQ
jgi:hypothetical protein